MPLLTLWMPLLLILLLLPLAGKKHFETLVPPFFFGLMLALLPFAMAGRLSAFPWLAWSVAAGLAVAAGMRCRREPGLIRRWPELLLTPGFVLFAAAGCLLWLSTQPRMVWWGDDIRYWALEPKSLFLSDGLRGARTLAPDFASYTPGMPLLQWLGVAMGGEWNEGALYFVLYLFDFAMLLPLAQGISWKKGWQILPLGVWIILFPTLFNAFTYYALGVDTAMGLCLGYALCQLWRMRENPSLFRAVCLALSLAALTLLKQSGAALALLCLPFAWAAGLKLKKRRWLGVAALPLLCGLLWAAYCGANHLGGIHTASAAEQLGRLLGGTWEAPEGFQLFPEAFGRAMTSGLDRIPYIEEHAFVEIPALAWMLVFLAVPFLMIPLARQHFRDMKRLCLWTAAALALETAAVYLSFFTSFYNELTEYAGEGSWLLPFLIQRYFCPVFLALGSLAAMLLGEGAPGKGGRWALAAGAAALLLVCGNWQGFAQTMIPENYNQQEHDYFADYLAEQNFWTDDLEDPDAAIVLCGIGERQSEMEKWRYALAPVRIVYRENPEDMTALLQKEGITHVVCLDDQNWVYDAAQALASDGWLDTDTAYAVSWEEGGPTLSY